MSISNLNNITLKGLLQSYKYFQKYADEIRREFTFSADVILSLCNMMKNVVRKLTVGVRLVGIHVRRGDKASNSKLQKSGFYVASQMYYEDAMNIMRTKYQSQDR